MQYELDLVPEHFPAPLIGDELEQEIPGLRAREALAKSQVFAAIDAGNSDPNKLTNTALRVFHPEWRGERFCRSKEIGALEWREINKSLVTPALAAKTGAERSKFIAKQIKWKHVGAEDYTVARGCPLTKAESTASCWGEETCTDPQTCGPIPDLMCARMAGGVPFEYPHKYKKVGSKRVVACAERFRLQKFNPNVLAALEKFVQTMSQVGLPLDAIITGGSYCCRCMAKRDSAGNVIRSPSMSNHSFGDAIDIMGVRLQPGTAYGTEILVTNHDDQLTRRALRRIDACLRLQFYLVIDFLADAKYHGDHFHCDFNLKDGGARLKTFNPLNSRFIRDAVAYAFHEPPPAPKKSSYAEGEAAVGALARFAAMPRGTKLDENAWRTQYARLLWNTAMTP